MWRCVVGYLSTFRTITLPSSSGSNSASIIICPVIFRNVGNHSPQETQRSIINTRFLCNTCGKNPRNPVPQHIGRYKCNCLELVKCDTLVGPSCIARFPHCSTVKASSVLPCSPHRLSWRQCWVSSSARLYVQLQKLLHSFKIIFRKVYTTISIYVLNFELFWQEAGVVARTWDINGVLKVTLVIYFRHFKKTLLSLQPTSSRKWKWGAKKIIQCTFQVS